MSKDREKEIGRILRKLKKLWIIQSGASLSEIVPTFSAGGGKQDFQLETWLDKQIKSRKEKIGKLSVE